MIKEQVKGFSLIEIVVAIAVLVMIIILSSGLYSQIKKMEYRAQNNTQATMLAQEANEAMRSIQKNNYSLMNTGVYGISNLGGEWSLIPNFDTVGNYKRSITITDVSPDKKEVEVNISWEDDGDAKSIKLNSYFTNYQKLIGGGDWTQPIESGFFNLATNNDARAIFVTSSKLYLLTDGEGGDDFYIFDLSSTSSAQLLSSIDIGEKGRDLFGVPPNIYLATGDQSREEQTIFVENLISPYVSGYYNLSDNKNARGITVRGNYAYITTDRRASVGEFFILDISVPTQPVLKGSYEVNDKVNKVAVSGNYAFLATSGGNQELIILDISNPTNPLYVSSLNVSGGVDANDVAVDGNILYMVTDKNSYGREFYAVDISNILNLTVIALLEYGDDINSISLLSSAYAFIGGKKDHSQMNIIDISNLPELTVVGQYDAEGEVQDVFFDNNIVYMATENNNKELQFIKATP
ncbi:MAG: hypothetical protein COU81_02460 [Candidatus Portnoybacteria bacterium CG10_big_fil_rev_8_21_14_0_10_36_7]|uniref:Prepilin-type N-terminal cleavage/methylation domain-containing protein n=1 Tax=Candidatus Portnoybacteria bacterium CG10_big_fil_rev_8_21_14_0_10_36_7 TaxID=1974812 RepID=A0A2M8KDY4_9BACT|nr:MAG: hypothetical protein COU81_02460 [Candidatus Portnoybacteria bacterium CG10_big_fil_rev_8_21_14_0_10_36_7]